MSIHWFLSIYTFWNCTLENLKRSMCVMKETVVLGYCLKKNTVSSSRLETTFSAVVPVVGIKPVRHQQRVTRIARTAKAEEERQKHTVEEGKVLVKSWNGPGQNFPCLVKPKGQEGMSGSHPHASAAGAHPEIDWRRQQRKSARGNGLFWRTLNLA